MLRTNGEGVRREEMMCSVRAGEEFLLGNDKLQ